MSSFNSADGLANAIQICDAPAGNNPVILAMGTDTNVSLQFSPQGSGSFLLPNQSGQGLQRIVNGVTTFQTLVQTSGGTALENMGISSPAVAGTMLQIGNNSVSPNSFFTSSGQVNGIFCAPTNTGTGDVLGVASEPTTHSSGTVGNVYGLFTANFVGASATVTSSYGYYCQSPIITAGGAITTQYGVRISLQKVAGVTTGYGIYQFHPSDINYFGGAVQLAGGLNNMTTATSATAGSNGDVPAQVVGYLSISINGTTQKIPYYAV